MARATVVMLGVAAVLVLATISTLSARAAGTQTIRAEGHDDANATWSPDGRRIAFTREYWEGRAEIWVVSADGTREHRITPVATNDRALVAAFSPVWSPDGMRVAYEFDTSNRDESGRSHRSGGIRVVAADGTGDRALTTKVRDRPKGWSRDGRRILFVRSGALWTVDVRTGRVRRVTAAAGRPDCPGCPGPGTWDGKWSHDGRWLATAAFSGEIHGGDEYDSLAIRTAAGGRPRRVVASDGNGDDSQLLFAWAPRGAQLAFASEWRLYVTTPTGKARRVPGARRVSAVAWSPNGTQLVWASRRRTSRTNAIYVADADGRRRRAIVTLETLAALGGDRASRPDPRELGFVSPSWAPGAQIAFSVRFPCNRRGIHVVNVRTRVIRRLTNRC